MNTRPIWVVTALILVTLATATDLRGQAYDTGVGLRAGVSNGLSVKHFIDDKLALEGILHSRWRGLVVTGLLESHRDIPEIDGLGWFFGGGVHLGSWNGHRDPRWAEPGFSGAAVFGIDGIIGLDYVFSEVPINLSLDYKPALNFSNNAGFWGDEFALSIRYVF